MAIVDLEVADRARVELLRAATGEQIDRIAAKGVRVGGGVQVFLGSLQDAVNVEAGFSSSRLGLVVDNREVVPNTGRRLGVAVDAVPTVAMHGDLDAATGGVIREQAEAGGGAIVVRSRFEQDMSTGSGVGAIDPSRDGDGAGGAEINGGGADVLIDAVGGDGSSDLSGDPGDAVDQSGRIAVTGGIGGGGAGTIIKSPTSDQAGGQSSRSRGRHRQPSGAGDRAGSGLNRCAARGNGSDHAGAGDGGDRCGGGSPSHGTGQVLRAVVTVGPGGGVLRGSRADLHGSICRSH